MNIEYDFLPLIINNMNVIIAREIRNKVLCEALCCNITWVTNVDNNKHPQIPPLRNTAHVTSTAISTIYLTYTAYCKTNQHRSNVYVQDFFSTNGRHYRASSRMICIPCYGWNSFVNGNTTRLCFY